MMSLRSSLSVAGPFLAVGITLCSCNSDSQGNATAPAGGAGGASAEGGAGGAVAGAGGGSTSALEPPGFSVSGGTYHHDVSLELSIAAAGASIYYTTDGSTPTASSTLYQNPIVIDNHVAVNHDPDPGDSNEPLDTVSRIVKAITIKEGVPSSEVVTASYVIDKVESYLNIAYDVPPTAGGDKHRLDVYKPYGQSGTKVIFFVHGGAWKQGDKNLYLELGNTFAGYYGLTTVVTNYEISADPWNAVFPDHIQDVSDAFQWTVAHVQEYGGDPQKIYLFGQSAGGHLVSLLAADVSWLAPYGRDNIKGVFSMSGAYDLPDFVQVANNPLGITSSEIAQWKALFQLVFGTTNDTTVLDTYSPSYHVNGGDTLPPFHVTDCWADMPGFTAEATMFRDWVQGHWGPSAVSYYHYVQDDIPPEVQAMTFDTDYPCHYEEIYAINTRNFDSKSTTDVVNFVQSH